MERTVIVLAALLVAGCSDQPWNSPYPPQQAGRNILYSSFNERPNHLDPAQSYSSNEVVFTGQIYEPPLQYHFLKRPYQLEPLTVTRMPEPYYLDAAGQRLPDNAAVERIAYSVYDLEIKPGIRYQPHPAFARGPDGEYLYHHIDESDLASVDSLSDFKQTGTRELTAADYVYQIKRLAHPHLHSPIFGLMSDYIVGLRDYAKTLKAAVESPGAAAF
ncbi:MAG: peptide ABC transporter substrate-binding protein, partial [Thiogranum sp.]|nr:peptide ABC transporter substrate-binding protein [Thiogranum sp.]